MTSTKDDRVHPGHARKMAKKLEAAGLPFLYYENIDGGHAAAAGLTIPRQRFEEFSALFERVAREELSEADLTRTIETDGELARDEFSLENAEALRDTVWGQGFPAPAFHGATSAIRLPESSEW